MAKFYRTTFTINVLSDEPIQHLADLDSIHYEITEGTCVGYGLKAHQIELTGPEMAKNLYKAGSEPDFFNLDDSGNTIDD